MAMAVWQTLSDHPEVLYGGALAFGIVVLLTPAVGGMARMLGVVDRPGSRRLNRRTVPRLGGLAVFFSAFLAPPPSPPPRPGAPGAASRVAPGAPRGAA